MTVTIPIQTIEELFGKLHKYDSDTEMFFVQELSTNDKYEILALIMMVRRDREKSCEDFEAALDAAKNKIPVQNLTKYFMERSSDNWQLLHCELQDVISFYYKYGWEWFELLPSNDADEDEEDEHP